MRRQTALAVWGVIAGVVLAACGAQAAAPEGEGQPAGGQAEGLTSTPASATPLPPREIVICAAQRPASLLDVSDPVAAAVWRLVSPQAAVFGADYTAESNLLAGLPSTQDGTLRRRDDGSVAVRLRYREDWVWSDGEPFDAADARLGLVHPATQGYGPAFEPVSVRQIDEYTLEVVFPYEAEYPYVPPQPPLPAHVLGEDFDRAAHKDTDLLTPALGPYVFAGEDGAEMAFQANPYYPGGVGLAPRLRLRFVDDPARVVAEVASGACDLALEGSFGPGQVDDMVATNVRLYMVPGPVYEQVLFNTYTGDTGRTPFFADARIRQAVARALDRAALALALWGELPPGVLPVLDSWIPPGHWAHPGADRLAQYPFDPTAAAALLDEAGWRDEDGDGTREYHGSGGTYPCGRGAWAIEEGTPLAPTLVIPAADPLRAQMADQMVQALAQIGIRLAVQPQAPDALFSPDGPLVRRSFDMALLAGFARPDPDGVSRWVGAEVFRHPLTGQPVHRWELEERWLRTEQMVERLAYNNIPSPDNQYQGQNYMGWCNEAANIATVHASLLALDEAEKRPFYEQQQVIFANELPVLPLYQRLRLAASSPELCGIEVGPYDPITWNIQTWTFDESGACQP